MSTRKNAANRASAEYPFPYDAKAIGLAPVAYWPLDDSTSTAIDLTLNGNNGSFVNAAGYELGAEGIGDGSRSVLFNEGGELNGYCNTYSAGLDSVFDGAEGSFGIWTKVLDASIWTDGITRYAIHNYADGDNRMYHAKMSTSNNWRLYYESGNVGKNVTAAVTTSVDWVHWLATWSEAADELKIYRNGVQWQGTSTSLGVWSAGALHSSFQKISTTQGTVGEWRGWLAKGIIFDRAVTVAEAVMLGRVDV